MDQAYAKEQAQCQIYFYSCHQAHRYHSMLRILAQTLCATVQFWFVIKRLMADSLIQCSVVSGLSK